VVVVVIKAFTGIIFHVHYYPQNTLLAIFLHK